MGFFNNLRERFADAVLHRPVLCHDPVLGELEEIGGGLWQAPSNPSSSAMNAHPVSVTVEGDLLLDRVAGG